LIRLSIVIFLLSIRQLSAQIFLKPDYPQQYFRNPLNIPMLLAGNFGELRPNHYHMGLDIKTQARENLPVYAAADGYIARIKIEPAGFGRAIYVNHPNGFTTVYAHLNNFNQELEYWVKQQQYKQQSWQVFLELPPDLFPVKKGAFLAYSGNTGGSQAPHVHFEIRRTADDVNLNPLLFGFPVADNTKPRILRLAVYDRTRSVYEQSPRLLPVKAAGAGYVTTPGTITVASPRVSFAIGAFDTQSGSNNLNGIFESALYVDEKPVIAFRMDNVSYNSTRYLNAHIDYKSKAGGGSFVQHLSELPGYVHSIYKQVAGNGVLDISDGLVHAVKVEVADAYGNTSVLNYKIRYTGTPVPKTGMPGKMFYPFMIDGYETDQCEFYIGERCLYDSVHIRYSRTDAANGQTVSGVHTIGAGYIPLQEAFLIRLLPTRSLTDAEKARTVMQWVNGSKTEVQKVEWQQSWAAARFRDFGNYRLVIDIEPPVILPIGFAEGAHLGKASGLLFTVKDNLNRVKNVRAELDGHWLRFTNDKGRTFIYRFDEQCLPGAHELKITAEDEAGNQVTKTIHFTR
jgi:hypothetical protein